MSRTKIEKTETIIAVDSEGTIFQINVFTIFTEYAPMNTPAQWIAGSKTLKMQNGNHVNLNDDGTFEDVNTGRVMRRV